MSYAKPYVCVLMNVPTIRENNKRVTRSLTPIRDLLREHGYRVSRVHAAWSSSGFQGHAVIEFGMSQEDCESAFKLEGMFKKAQHGLTEWEGGNRERASPYLWVVRDTDHNYVIRPCDYLYVPYATRHEGHRLAELDNDGVYEAVVNCFATFYPNQ